MKSSDGWDSVEDGEEDEYSDEASPEQEGTFKPDTHEEVSASMYFSCPRSKRSIGGKNAIVALLLPSVDTSSYSTACQVLFSVASSKESRLTNSTTVLLCIWIVRHRKENRPQRSSTACDTWKTEIVLDSGSGGSIATPLLLRT